MNTITEEEALNRMAAYCSAAEHCKAEVNEKLQKWGLPYEVINRIIDRLVVEKFIDEEQMCIRDRYSEGRSFVWFSVPWPRLCCKQVSPDDSPSQTIC